MGSLSSTFSVESKMTNSIPKEAPDSPLGVIARIQDLADAVRGLQVAAESKNHPLFEAELPSEAVSWLIEAHQALQAAQRVIGAHLGAGWSFDEDSCPVERVK
jgi:hypothetical protein